MVRKISLLLICIVLMFPVYFMVQGSFQAKWTYLRYPPTMFPVTPTIANYAKLMGNINFPRWVANTGLLFVVMVAGGIIVNGLAGYSFAFARFKYKQHVFWAFMLVLFVTRFSLIVPQFVIVNKLHLPGMWAVVLMTLFWPVGIYMFRLYFESISKSLLESARMDGAKEWVVFWRIVMPLSKPMIGVAAILLGMGALQDFVWQLLMLPGAEEQTMIVGLITSTYRAQIEMVKNVGLDLAAGTLLFVPLVILFLVSGKAFKDGLTKGAVKE